MENTTKNEKYNKNNSPGYSNSNITYFSHSVQVYGNL